MRNEGPKDEGELGGPPVGLRESDDPLEFVKPEDHPELMVLLEKLRSESVDGDPFNVKYAKARRAAGEEGAEMAVVTAVELRKDRLVGERRATRIWARPWFLGLLVLVIVAPPVTLGLALLLRRGAPELEKRVDRSAVVAVATGKAADTDTDTAAGTGVFTETAAGIATGTATGADAVTGTAAAIGAGATRRSLRPGPMPVRGKEPLPKETPAAPSASPSGTADAARPPVTQPEKEPSPSGGSEFF